MSERIFYLVWSPQGGPPSIRHDNYQEACVEAKRLATGSFGRRFYVLKASEFFERRDIDHIVLAETEDVPF